MKVAKDLDLVSLISKVYPIRDLNNFPQHTPIISKTKLP